MKWEIVPPRTVCSHNPLGEAGECYGTNMYRVHHDSRCEGAMCEKHFVRFVEDHRLWDKVTYQHLNRGDFFLQDAWPGGLLRAVDFETACDPGGHVLDMHLETSCLRLPRPTILRGSVLPFGILIDGEGFERDVNGQPVGCVKDGTHGVYVDDYGVERRCGPIRNDMLVGYLSRVAEDEDPDTPVDGVNPPIAKDAEGINRVDGPRRQFATGASRQAAKGKGTPVLVCPWAYEELAKHFEAGAEIYEPRNWEKGMPLSELINSAERHLIAIKKGLTDERHDRAFAWNAFVFLGTLARIRAGILPESLNDLPKYKKVGE